MSSIHIYNNHLPLEQLLELIKIHKSYYYSYLKTNYSQFYQLIEDNYPGNKFTEKLYNYCFPSIHTCVTCNSPDVAFIGFSEGYRKYCSRNCTSNSTAAIIGRENFYSNPTKIIARYDSMIQRNITKTGYAHHMHNPLIKERILTKSIATRRAKYYSEQIGTLTLKQYTNKIRYLTNIVYNQYTTTIDPLNQRSINLVVDHIFSIFDGYKNSVPVEIICHPSNLQIIDKVTNSSKHSRSDKSLDCLYNDCIAYSIEHLIT